jgi:hypothetical protein
VVNLGACSDYLLTGTQHTQGIPLQVLAPDALQSPAADALCGHGIKARRYRAPAARDVLGLEKVGQHDQPQAEPTSTTKDGIAPAYKRQVMTLAA